MSEPTTIGEVAQLAKEHGTVYWGRWAFTYNGELAAVINGTAKDEE